MFEALCVAQGLVEPVAEYRFHPTRKWRFDYAWPEFAVALEIEGGVWTGGRHTRGAGFLGDVDKYNSAAIAGWCVIRCLPADIKSGRVFDLLARVIAPVDGNRVCRKCGSTKAINWAEENLCETCEGN